MRQFIVIGIALAYAAFIILIILLVLSVVYGCASSDAVQYARMKYPGCDVSQVGATRFETTVEVRCKYREPFTRTYRNRE